MATTNKQDLCWCDSGTASNICCGPLLDGQAHAKTALALMRSRYCAYVTRNEAYLLATWQPATRPARIQFDDEQRWLGLKIVRVEAGKREDDSGLVEFVARYKVSGRGFRLHELSRFEQVDGRWLYMDGELR